MTPELRKEASELQLHKRGIRINLQLPLTESNEEVTLRTSQALERRLLALWAVSGTARQPGESFFRDYLAAHQLQDCLSAQEAAFMTAPAPDAETCLRYARRQESLYFLAWCAGLVGSLGMPAAPAKLQPLLKHFPTGMEPPRLQVAIRSRHKNEILGWSDLLYRLHWAARHAHLTGRPTPAGLDYGILLEWHQAVNWVCGYEEQDDWDQVGTET